MRPSGSELRRPGARLGKRAASPTAQIRRRPGARCGQRLTPNIVVLDPAHGGTDPGARGTAGIRESEIVMEFTAQIRTALESAGFQVMVTRQGNENPSFDDRSAIANAQRGAMFVTLHVASTGLPGTVRVYVMSDLRGSERRDRIDSVGPRAGAVSCR